MTGSGRYRGWPVSSGMAVGEIYQGDARPASLAAEAAAGPSAGAALGNGHGRAHAEDAVREAFGAVAKDRAALAAELRTRGQGEQAAIVEIAALIAADPALVTAAVEEVSAGASAADAIRQAGEAQAALLAALPDPDLAQRAGDVRQVAKAASDWLTGSTAARPPVGKFILVRREVEAADLIRLADAGLVGAVSVHGSASSHAAIIARGLGLPMVAGVDLAVLGATGQQAIVNGVAGELVTDPGELELAAAEAVVAVQAAAIQDAATVVAMAVVSTAARPATAGASQPDRLASGAGGELKTADGQPVTLLCNVASAAETRLGLSAGAAGVDLLRTEIAFTGATEWPSLDDHLAQLTPILGLLGGRPAVIRLLDFSGDKVPPFLASRARQGLDALLDEKRALRAQLTAILRAGRGAQVSVLVPMVRSLAEVAAVRAALAEAATAEGAVPPKLGIMVEVAATAANAAAFAAVADFFSIGTNDLTSDVLALDRGADQAATPALAADPRVLVLIRDTARAAAAAGIAVSVCGDAAADPLVLPLLLGVGIRTLSVGAARVPIVAWDIADTDTATARAQAEGMTGLCGPPPAQPSAERTTPPRPAPRSRDTARAASVTRRTSSSRLSAASSRSAAPTTPIAPATVPSLATMGAAIPASPTVASWSSTA
jgi:phosphoenolpyruvate-protein kinase (PTS system EI component)